MTIVPPESQNNGQEGSIALRNFFNELFEERARHGESDTFDSDSVSLSSDEETATTRSSTIDHTKNNDSTRRRRSRHSMGRKHFRSLTISPDNAAGIRRGSKTELMVHSYHNPTTGSISARRYSLSTSLHSLGSLTEISASSVGSWRSSLHKHRASLKSRQAAERKNHKDSRWSTGPLDKSKKSRSNKVKQYDFGFVNDSMHVRNNRRSKKDQRASMARRTNSSNTPRTSNRKGFSSRTIEKAVRVVNAVSSSEDESSEGEEFFEDDEVSLSGLTDSFASSRANTTISSIPTIGSSLDFGSRYKKKAKALEFSPRVAPSRTKYARVAPSRTKSDLPRLPRRTKDDLFFKLEETFEPLRGNSSSHRGGFQKPKMRRSLSDDVSTLSTSIKLPQRLPDPGRWAATITNKDSDSPNNDSVMKTPRRVPSLSSRSNSSKKKAEGKLLKVSSRSTGRYSNHSNDSSEPSDSDSDCDLHDSFAYDDDTATMATKGNQSCSTESSFEKDGTIKFLLNSSSAHSRRLSIPDSLRKLPHHSFHGSSTISTNVSSRGKRQHPGKSLRTTSRA